MSKFVQLRMNSHDQPHSHDHGSLHPHGMEEPPVSGVSGVPLVELSNVSNSYGATLALQDVSLKIWPGQFLAIVGPNGGGKTTLLRTILGTVPIRQGKVLLRGKDPQRSALERIGYVPQLETIDWNFPITVEEVVCMGFFGKNRWFRAHPRRRAPQASRRHGTFKPQRSR